MAVPQGLEGIWDPARYISVDEIKPGMEAYCLTVYKGTAVEKFGVEVLSVVHDFMPAGMPYLFAGPMSGLFTRGLSQVAAVRLFI